MKQILLTLFILSLFMLGSIPSKAQFEQDPANPKTGIDRALELYCQDQLTGYAVIKGPQKEVEAAWQAYKMLKVKINGKSFDWISRYELIDLYNTARYLPGLNWRTMTVDPDAGGSKEPYLTKQLLVYPWQAYNDNLFMYNNPGWKSKY